MNGACNDAWASILLAWHWQFGIDLEFCTRTMIMLTYPWNRESIDRYVGGWLRFVRPFPERNHSREHAQYWIFLHLPTRMAWTGWVFIFHWKVTCYRQITHRPQCQVCVGCVGKSYYRVSSSPSTCSGGATRYEPRTWEGKEKTPQEMKCRSHVITLDKRELSKRVKLNPHSINRPTSMSSVQKDRDTIPMSRVSHF